VDGVDFPLLGKRDDSLDIEVGRNGPLVLADQIGFVGLESVQAKAVFLGLDALGAQPELGGGAHDADRDFSAVGGKKFLHTVFIRLPGSANPERDDANCGPSGVRDCAGRAGLIT
jgi:hypothetical protein